MKRRKFLIMAGGAAALCSTRQPSFGKPNQPVRQSQGRPNVVFILADDLELYNLNKDMGEKNNLAEKNPEKAAELLKLLRNWRKEVGAVM